MGYEHWTAHMDWKDHEILAVNTNKDRSKFTNYLANKWGITLTQNQTLASKDSSGNNHHGILKKKFDPTAQTDLKLWLDAADTTRSLIHPTP